jgi:hypothetical protein
MLGGPSNPRSRKGARGLSYSREQRARPARCAGSRECDGFVAVIAARPCGSACIEERIIRMAGKMTAMAKVRAKYPRFPEFIRITSMMAK